MALTNPFTRFGFSGSGIRARVNEDQQDATA
jgi:hypothetical protein